MDDVVDQLAVVEQLAEDVLSEKQQVVELDRRRQQTREALRTLQKDKSDEKRWVCFGDMFIKMQKPQVKSMLDKDFKCLEERITEARGRLKPKVNALRDAQHQESLKGFDLEPLSKQEWRSVKQAII